MIAAVPSHSGSRVRRGAAALGCARKTISGRRERRRSFRVRASLATRHPPRATVSNNAKKLLEMNLSPLLPAKTCLLIERSHRSPSAPQLDTPSPTDLPVSHSKQRKVVSPARHKIGGAAFYQTWKWPLRLASSRGTPKRFVSCSDDNISSFRPSATMRPSRIRTTRSISGMMSAT
jgi:hypothetical protein